LAIKGDVMPRLGYDIEHLKSDGSHYVIVAIPPQPYMWIPDGSYEVKVAIPNKEIVVQVIIEKRERALTDEEKKDTVNEDLLFYSHIDVFIPVRGPNGKIDLDRDAVSNWIYENSLFFRSIAIHALSKITLLYRSLTGECHIQPLSGLSDWSIAVLFNENPQKETSTYRAFGREYSDGSRIFPMNVEIPEVKLDEMRQKLLSSFDIPIYDELLFNAHNFLRQGNTRLAIIEAETAFEIAVIQFLRLFHQNNANSLTTIESIHSFTQLLNHTLAQAAFNSRSVQFARTTPLYETWKMNIWEIRGALVHGKRETVSTDDADKAILTIENTLQALFGRQPTAIYQFRKMI
jgi:hypothetical protein